MKDRTIASSLFILWAQSLSTQRKLVNKNRVGGRKQETWRVVSQWKENILSLSVPYSIIWLPELYCGWRRRRRGWTRSEKGVLISANQSPYSFSLVCTAQAWMFPADVLWKDCALRVFLVYRLLALRTLTYHSHSSSCSLTLAQPHVKFWPMVLDILATKSFVGKANHQNMELRHRHK